MRGKDQTPSPALYQLPAALWLEVCPLELNSPWCPHQFVVSAVGIVTQLPLSLDAAAGTDSNGGFLISPGAVDIKKVEIAQTWAPGQRCLTYSWGPPGDFQASIPPLHNEKVPPATKSKPESTAHSTSAKPGEANEQRKAVMFYCRHGPIKAFHSDFHGGHFILMVSMDRSSMPVRFRGADGAGTASPWWCSPHLAADIPHDPAAVCCHLSSPQKQRITLLAGVALRSQIMTNLLLYLIFLFPYLWVPSDSHGLKQCRQLFSFLGLNKMSVGDNWGLLVPIAI